MMERKVRQMRRGQIYYADLRPVIGSEQGGIRPCVIIQNDMGNYHSPTVIVAMMTRQRKNDLPTHIAVSEEDYCLDQNTTILLEQLRTIDKSRLSAFVGKLSDGTMRRVDEALHISLALNKEEREAKAKMEELQIFSNSQFGEIRISVKDGEPMFCLSDICKALELTQPSKVKERLNEKGVNTIPTLTKGGTQNLLYINESNLYKAIFQSRKESAEQFTEWVTGEVLPTIRKTGGYQAKPMSPEEMMRVQLGMIDEDRKQIKDHESRIENLENNTTLDYGQQRVLEDTVNKTVISALGGKESNAYKEIGKKVFAECNHDLKSYFKVNARANVPKKRFEEAVQYAEDWKPCMNTKMLIAGCNS